MNLEGEWTLNNNSNSKHSGHCNEYWKFERYELAYLSMKVEEICAKGIAYFTQRDIILYALGIGCGDNVQIKVNTVSHEIGRSSHSSSLVDGNDGSKYTLRYLYENHDEFIPFPTFPLVLPFRAQTMSHRDDLLNDSSNSTHAKVHDFIRVFFGMSSFPTPMMQDMNILDHLQLDNEGKTSLGGDGTNDFEIKAIIHLSENYRLHKDIPNEIEPTLVRMKTYVISIQFKRIGIIVVTETEYFICKSNHDVEHNKTVESNVDKISDDLFATSQSTTLYITNNPMKADPIFNTKYNSTLSQPNISPSTMKKHMKENKPNCVITQSIPNNQALIYRLSGDTNPIHVLATGSTKTAPNGKSSPSSSLSMDRPILHGLCTLGFAVRAIMEYCHALFNESTNDPMVGALHDNGNHSTDEIKFHYVTCQFTKPVFIGDELRTLIWLQQNESKPDGNILRLFFRVERTSDDVIVVDKGIVDVGFKSQQIFTRSKI